MIKFLAKACAVSAFVAGINLTVVAPAQAQSPVASGRRCGFTSVTDPTIEGGEIQTGQINGGPLAAAAAAATITLRCTIQVGASNSTHAGANSCQVASSPSIQVATLPPTLCSYLSPEGQPVYMCTEVEINGTTYYWDATETSPGPPPTVVGWSADPNGSCNEAISQEIFPGPFEPVLDLIDQVLTMVGQIADSVICNLLGSLAPGIPGVVDITPEGDVYIHGVGFWDCPPYGNVDGRFIDLVPVTVVLEPGNNSGTTPAAPVNCYFVEVRVVAGGSPGPASGTATCGTLTAAATVPNPPGTAYDSAVGAAPAPGTCTKTAAASAEPVTVSCTFWVSPF